MCVSNLFVNRPGTDKNLVEKSLTKWERRRMNNNKTVAENREKNKTKTITLLDLKHIRIMSELGNVAP